MKTFIIEDKQRIESIILHCDACFVGITDLEGNPYVVPMNFGYENGVLLRNIHENSTHKKTGRGSHILASAPCSFFAYLTFPFSISSSGNCGRASISFFVIDWRISSLISCFVLQSEIGRASCRERV